jgi:hypothetical protein
MVDKAQFSSGFQFLTPDEGLFPEKRMQRRIRLGLIAPAGRVILLVEDKD